MPRGRQFQCRQFRLAASRLAPCYGSARGRADHCCTPRHHDPLPCEATAKTLMTRAALARCAANQFPASSTTASSAPGSSNRCVAPGTMASCFSQRSSASAARLKPSTAISSPPTISSVGAVTAVSAARRDRAARRATRSLRPGRSRCRCRDERRCSAGAGAEIADRQAGRFRILVDPGGRHLQSVGEESDVEDVAAVALLSVRQQIEQQGGEAGVAQWLERQSCCAG